MRHIKSPSSWRITSKQPMSSGADLLGRAGEEVLVDVLGGSTL